MIAVIEFLGSIVDYVVNFFQSIIWFITNLPKLFLLLEVTIGFAPQFLMGFLILSLAATALFAIIRLF